MKVTRYEIINHVDGTYSLRCRFGWWFGKWVTLGGGMSFGEAKERMRIHSCNVDPKRVRGVMSFDGTGRSLQATGEMEL